MANIFKKGEFIELNANNSSRPKGLYQINNVTNNGSEIIAKHVLINSSGKINGNNGKSYSIVLNSGKLPKGWTKLPYAPPPQGRLQSLVSREANISSLETIAQRVGGLGPYMRTNKNVFPGIRLRGNGNTEIYEVKPEYLENHIKKEFINKHKKFIEFVRKNKNSVFVPRLALKNNVAEKYNNSTPLNKTVKVKTFSPSPEQPTPPSPSPEQPVVPPSPSPEQPVVPPSPPPSGNTKTRLGVPKNVKNCITSVKKFAKNTAMSSISMNETLRGSLQRLESNLGTLESYAENKPAPGMWNRFKSGMAKRGWGI